jgi:chemotaxis protein CheX
MTSSSQVAGDNVLSLESWRASLCDATIEVFSMMVGEEVSFPDDPNQPLLSEITGLLGMAGAFCGVFSLRCSTQAAISIASQMLCVPAEEAAGQKCDAVGEICNMVAGNFKAKVEGLEDKCLLAVPTVITGKDYQLYSISAGERLELPLLFKGEPIWIALEAQK